jgi:hypothetical protein
MKWISDPSTEHAARRWHPIPITHEQPSAQFAGHVVDPDRANGRIAQPAHWPAGMLKSSPETIIGQFRNGHFTQALELVISWGGMARARCYIYRDWSPSLIESTLGSCAEAVINTQSIESAWTMLTGTAQGQLGWSAVIASKTLHFLCRAAGLDADPPVALDNGVMRNIVWPRFKATFSEGERPKDWSGNDFEAYIRYMTAIRVWAADRNWSTTALEATLYAIAKTQAQVD